MSSERKKSLASFIWVLVFALAAINTLLVRQNLAMRDEVKSLQEKLDPASTNMHPGDLAQPFSATDVAGRQYKVDYDGGGRKKVFLFFTPRCPFCSQQVPYWKELLDNIDPSRYEVVGITGEREDKAKISEYLKEVGYSDARYPLQVAFAPDNVLRSYRLTSTPTTLLVANDGKVEEVWVGRWDTAAAAKASGVLSLPQH